MKSILSIPDRRDLLVAYLDPASRYAWPSYDEDYAPGSLSGVDLAAPALLSYPLRSECLQEMGRTGVGSPYERLVLRLRDFVAVPGSESFTDLAVSQVAVLKARERGASVQGPRWWVAFIECLDAVQTCPTLTMAVTKILHRKRPDRVPINDDRLRRFYGAGNRYGPLFAAICADLRQPQVRRELGTWVRGVHTPSGRPLTELRALDIIVWMHQGRSV